MHYRLSLWLVFCVLTACATQQQPEKTDLFEVRQQAMAAYAKGDWETARKKLVEVTKRVPKEVDSWFRLGNVYAHMHLPAEAIVAYREALVRQPDLAKAWHNLTVMHLRQANSTLLEMIKHIDPTHPLYRKGERMAKDIRQILQGDNKDTASSSDPKQQDKAVQVLPN